MKTNKFFGLIVLLVFALFVSACGGTDQQVGVLPQGTPPPDTGGSEVTEPPATVPMDVDSAVESTLTAMAQLTETPVPTDVPVATVTPTLTATQPTTPTANPTSTATPFVADGEFVLNGNLPASGNLLASVRNPGDGAVFVITFFVDFPRAVLLKVAPDDELIEAGYYPLGGTPVDLLSLLKVGSVTQTEPSDKFLRQVMGTRGIETDRHGDLIPQLLPHNYQAVDLGTVKAGSMLIFRIKDNVNLAVNRGLNWGITADSDQYTVDLAGNPVTATFVVTPRPS